MEGVVDRMTQIDMISSGDIGFVADHEGMTCQCHGSRGERGALTAPSYLQGCDASYISHCAFFFHSLERLPRRPGFVFDCTESYSRSRVVH